MVTFAPVDILIAALFIVFLLFLGFSAKLADNSVLQYISAGRKLTLPMFVSTLVCTWYGGILGIGESVSYYGVGTMLLLGVPYYVFGLLFAFVLAKKVRGAHEISLPERMRLQFGRGPGLLAAGLIFLLAVPSAHVLMLGILVQLFTGWSLWVSVGVSALVGSLFLYRGGLLADVRASILAFLMMYIGFATMVVICLGRTPFNAMLAQLPAPALATPTGGQSWTMILSFFILGAWTMVDPGFHQRVASAETPEVGRKGVVVSVAMWFVFDLLSITTGLYAIHFIKTAPANSLMYFPLLGEMVLPAGLKAVFLCGILGTVTCAMVGYALVSGSTIGREIVAVLRPSLNEDQVKNWTRAGIGLAMTLAAIIGTSVASVVTLWYALGGVVTGALLIPVLIAYLKPKDSVSATTVSVAIVGSFAVSLGWWIYATRAGNPYMTVDWGGNPISVGTLLPGLLVSWACVGLGSLAKIGVNRHG